MRLIETRDELREYLDVMRKNRFSVGFVPTMGAYHEGHLSLFRAAAVDCDKVVASLFVNPTQFGPEEDLDRYPRDLGRDRALAEEAGVDVLFAPSVSQVYPEGFATYVEVSGLSGLLCGKARSGHFRGVTTVVLKLLNLVEPDVAYFGQKDAQQAAIVKRMVRDLDVSVEIRAMPIVREEDGLAMSSRNRYLDASERSAATVLHRALLVAQARYVEGERVAEALRGAVTATLDEEPLAKAEYVEVVHPETLEPLTEIGGEVLVAVAARVGSTRLIDNVVLGGPPDLMLQGPRH